MICSPYFQTGDLVTQRVCWLLGRIIEISPEKDCVVGIEIDEQKMKYIYDL